ncbi:phosphomannomutase [Rheinheimera sp. A13L]|uniref:phosphomannomutase n=1 Tax=Rheinheimera sp. A13L TaxID=506534 RepID=UPI00021252FF|nr:phosphomannomutase [Rheinheimera sp. A13L]EGM78109.1 phosphomannomutase [Rheinheimera sp. A13L]
MDHFISSTLIRQSSVQFGTSGARGLVVDFTPELCCAFTLAFIKLLQQSQDVQRIALAIDNRPSSPEIAAWCAAAVQQLGLELDYYGVIPTPALAYAAMKQGVAAIMVTGSHIPFDRNGLKFYRPQGEITKQDELKMLSVEVPFSLPVHAAELTLNPAAAHDYKQRYLDWFPQDLAKGLTIGIYEHSSAGRDIYAELLQQLGACVIRLGRSDHFVPIDTEAVSEEDEQKAVLWTQEHQLDLLFSTDGDGDRPMVADEQGCWLRGDVLGLLAAKALKIQALAVPVSCNSAIEQSGWFLQVLRTRIGSPYVIEAFDQLEQYPAVAGFEANGGFLLASDLQKQERYLTALPTRDAILPLLAVIELARGRAVSELLSELPKRFTASQRLSDFATELSQQLLSKAAMNADHFVSDLGLDTKVLSVDTTDGLRFTLTNGDIVHLRPSGNAPELRCYAESVSEPKAKALVAKVLAKVPALILHL